MRQKPVLSHDDVLAIAAATRGEAQRNGWAVSIALVDDGGHPLYLERLDGARANTVAVALGKARTSALLHAPSAGIASRVKDNPALLALDLMPLQGGLPLMCGEHCVGGLGVSGVQAHQDEQAGAAGTAVLERIWHAARGD
ncbi:MAG: heme-binding protein [Steroidobacteraceae bacterium]|jgi:glc operon protein GlcG|nr:heme-binding protein [Steroidobacteraceae bacterium]